MKRNRILPLTLVSGLFAVLLGQVLWLFVISPRMAVSKIVLESDLNLSDAQILEMLKLGNETWASVDSEVLEQRLESYPVVRRAQVSREFPDTLRLYIYRRRPLAAALTGERGTPAVFDEEGYAVQVGTGSLNYPLISGPVFPKPAPGARLPDSIRLVLDDLAQLRSQDSRMFDLISEVEIIPHSSGSYDLKLFMNHTPVPVLIGQSLTGEAVRQAVLVLDLLTDVSRIKEADIRGSRAVLREEV